MTEVKIETSQRKNRWPLWLLIGLLIAGLAATQVPSLRLALARVLVLSGPRLTRDWARGQISSTGPLAAPILLEWCIQAFSRIRDENDENDENDEELVDDFYQALEDCETCIDRCPEVLAELLMATRARAPEALRQRLYHYAIVRLHDCPQEQRAAFAPVSIDRLVEMGREVYATLPPSFMDLAGEERISPELLEHLLSLGVPLSELDAIYAQRLAEPNPIKRLPILEALDFAVSEHRDSERIPEESRIFKVLLSYLENDSDGFVNEALDPLLNQDWNEIPCEIFLALAARNKTVLIALENSLLQAGPDFFDEEADEAERELESEFDDSSAESSDNLSASESSAGSEFLERDPDQRVTQRQLVKGLLRHRKEQSLSFVLWAWTTLAQLRAVPSWEPELALALSKARPDQRAAILFVLAHFSPIFDWIEPELRRSLASQDHRERCAALYATALAIGQDEARLQILLNASADQRAHSRRVILLGSSGFAPAQRVQLIRALNLNASPESWSPLDLRLLAKALANLDLESLGLSQQALSQIIEKLKDPLALESLALILRSPAHKTLRSALVATRLRLVNEAKPGLEFIDACFSEFSFEHRSKLLPAPESSAFATEYKALNDIDPALASQFNQLVLAHRIQQPADSENLENLTTLLEIPCGASLPVYILNHGDDAQGRIRSPSTPSPQRL